MNEEFIEKCEKQLSEQFKIIDEISFYNTEKVLNAFKKNRIALRHFCGTTGYGYGDEGRDTLNSLVADIFKTEDAIVSPNIVSGTHALSLCLFGILRPNDKVLCITGEPYDTLKDVINGSGNGALSEYGVEFHTIPLIDGKIDFDSVKKEIRALNPKMVYMQRSRGYDWRNAFSVDDIEKAVKFVRECGFDGCIMLDNCYGEFIEKREATEVGVNVLAGSLIKNLCGGIAPTGGYVAGEKKYVELIGNRMTAPSIGREVGSYAFGYREFYQGLFVAPHTVAQAIKGSMLVGAVMSESGYETSPKPYELPKDIIRAIKFNDKDKLISFIQNVQYNSPVDSFVEAIPWAMPGYEDEVIMSAGCFVQGSSIELSADAPVRPPYIAYMQGGLTYEHCKIALKNLKF